MYTHKEIVVIECFTFTYNASKMNQMGLVGIVFIPSFVIFHVDLVITKHVTVLSRHSSHNHRDYQDGGEKNQHTV